MASRHQLVLGLRAVGSTLGRTKQTPGFCTKKNPNLTESYHNTPRPTSYLTNSRQHSALIWFALQCSKSKQCTVSRGNDHMPVSWGYMRAQYPLPMAQILPQKFPVRFWGFFRKIRGGNKIQGFFCKNRGGVGNIGDHLGFFFGKVWGWGLLDLGFWGQIWGAGQVFGATRHLHLDAQRKYAPDLTKGRSDLEGHGHLD